MSVQSGTRRGYTIPYSTVLYGKPTSNVRAERYAARELVPPSLLCFPADIAAAAAAAAAAATVEAAAAGPVVALRRGRGGHIGGNGWGGCRMTTAAGAVCITCFAIGVAGTGDRRRGGGEGRERVREREIESHRSKEYE